MAGHKFLIVENDPDALALWEYVQTNGDAILYCKGGISTLRELNRIGYDVEAIIVDLMLDDMDGMTLTEHIRRNQSIRSIETPILVFWFTGYPVNETILREKVKLKVTEIFIKPMSPVDLIGRVKGYLAIQE